MPIIYARHDDLSASKLLRAADALSAVLGPSADRA